MRVAIFTLILFFASNLQVHAGCSKEKVCAMLGKSNHFEILDKCPGSGPLLTECKKTSETTIEDLPQAKFVDNGDGTVTDTVNNLMWTQKGHHDEKGTLKKVKLKEAKKIAAAASTAGRDNWRLPSLPELKTLIFSERVANISGQKAWVNPVFDDGRGHYYWTSTTCAEVSVITDRYQKKLCQQGDSAAWLVHFNINAVFWHFVTTENFHVWLVSGEKSGVGKKKVEKSAKKKDAFDLKMKALKDKMDLMERQRKKLLEEIEAIEGKGQF